VGPRAGLDGRKISFTPGFDPGHNYQLLHYYYECIIKYIINTRYNYFISDKVLHEECDKKDNMEVTGGCYHFLFEKRTVKRSVQCHVFAQSPTGPHPNDK